MMLIKNVELAKQGDKEALLELILDKKDEYYKLAYVYMKNSDETMDAVEDMIVILYEKIKFLKKNEAFYSWSKTILVNCCKKQLKKKKKLIYIHELPNSDTKIIEKENQISLENALNNLKPKHQEAIKLKYYMNYTYNEIADLTNIPIGTVKSRISTALKILKIKLEGDFNE